MIKQGFTLIELLIVVAIIGILAAIAVPNFLNAQLKAKLSRAQSELKSVGDSYLLYFMDQNGWPGHLDGQPAQHKFVTTPIAYLNTSVIDIFASQPGEANFFATFWGQYHAEPATTHHSRIMVRSIYDQTWDVAFFITSIGPTDTHHPNIIYDISNGLRTSGDILYFTYGNNTGKYPFHTRPRR